ncbi:hypothetical protein ACFQJ7_07790 [Halovenus rubra]|uniref:Uncharacterized protein n=2 Tax=Halovenus rubra TaxID=869890 RepID=A0ACC7E2E0_9EURY|nr:hypothetical protein [Halovenus rubra]
MTMYNRSTAGRARVVGEWSDAVSWISYPDEDGKRASHAIRTDEGVWILDPLDAPNVDDLVADLGDVAGVAVLSCYHARDADTVARRHDVPVHVPEWMGRIAERLDTPVKRYTLAPGGSETGFHTFLCRPFPGWQEVFLYHDPTETLVIPDSLGTCDQNRIRDERLGLVTLCRLRPPKQLRGLNPNRILVGHGEPIDKDAATALDTALDAGPLSFPKAFVEHGPESIRSMLEALR